MVLVHLNTFAHLLYNQSYRYSCVIQWYYYNRRLHHKSGCPLNTRQYLEKRDGDTIT